MARPDRDPFRAKFKGYDKCLVILHLMRDKWKKERHFGIDHGFT